MDKLLETAAELAPQAMQVWMTYTIVGGIVSLIVVGVSGAVVFGVYKRIRDRRGPREG